MNALRATFSRTAILLTATAMQLLLIPPAASFAETPVVGGTLKIVGTGDLDHFDPASAGMVITDNFLRATQRRLISYAASTDADVRITPVGDIATEVPQPSADGLTYTFTIRDGAMWDAPSGPRQITSADFVLGMKRMCNPVVGSSALTYYTGLIQGMVEFCDGFAKVEPTVDAMKAYVAANQITGIETPDDKTIVIKLIEPAGDFVYMLSLAPASPAPVESMDYIPDSPEYRKNYIASGPYKVAEYTADVVMKLVRNPAWKPDSSTIQGAYVDEIEVTYGIQPDAAIQQLQTGDADMLFDITIPPAQIQLLSAAGDEKLIAIGTGRTAFLFINTVSGNNNSALKDLRVRQAIAYAIDKAAIVQQVGGPDLAAPQNGIFGPGVVGYHDFNLYPSADGKGDPEKAKALLAEAGFPDGITLKMPFRNQNTEPAIAETIQASLSKAGITLELTPVPPSDYYAKFMTNPENTQNGTWDIAPVGWAPDWVGGAARSVFQPQFTFDGHHQTYNYTDYNNEAATALAKQAINATNPEEMAKLWAQVDELVMADIPVIPFIAPTVVLYHSDAVQNFQPYALGGQGDWTNVWLQR